MRRESLSLQREDGLHARPAAEFVRMTKGFDASVLIEKQGEVADGKSILEVLALGCDQGDVVTLIVDGPDEDTALARLLEWL